MKAELLRENRSDRNPTSVICLRGIVFQPGFHTRQMTYIVNLGLIFYHAWIKRVYPLVLSLIPIDSLYVLPTFCRIFEASHVINRTDR